MENNKITQEYTLFTPVQNIIRWLQIGVLNIMCLDFGYHFGLIQGKASLLNDEYILETANTVVIIVPYLLLAGALLAIQSVFRRYEVKREIMRITQQERVERQMKLDRDRSFLSLDDEIIKGYSRGNREDIDISLADIYRPTVRQD